MKPNSRVNNLYGHVYNNFYNALSRDIEFITTERPFGKETYIPVPSTENSIRNYVSSNHQRGIALLVGPRGSGKTAVCHHLHRKYRTQKRTLSIYLDVRRYGASIEEYMKENKLPASLSENFLRPVRAIISSNIRRVCQNMENDYNFDFSPEKFIKYANQYHSHVIPDEYFRMMDPLDYYPNDPEKGLETLFEHSYYFVRLFFVINSLREMRKVSFSRIFLILDNVDQQPFDIIQSYLHCLSHFNGCAISSNVPRRKKRVESQNLLIFKSIMSVRRYNLENLEDHSDFNTLGSHGTEIINHLEYPAFCSILRKRTRRIFGGTEYTTSRGLKINKKFNKQTLLHHIITNLEHNGSFTHLLHLHNGNYCEALKSLRRIIQNNIFPDYDGFIKHLMKKTLFKEDENDDKPIFIKPYTMHKYLQCVLYGNPSDFKSAVYPPQQSVIPNIVFFGAERASTFLICFRLYDYLHTFGCNSIKGHLIDAMQLYIDFQKSFGASYEDVFSAIKFCQEKKLIVARAGKIDRDTFLGNGVSLARKFDAVVGAIDRHGEIFTAMCDDTNMPEDYLSVRNGSKGKNLIVKRLRDLVRMELAQFTALKNTGIVDEYVEKFGKTIWSEKIARALRRDIKRNNYESAELQDVFEIVDEQISEINSIVAEANRVRRIGVEQFEEQIALGRYMKDSMTIIEMLNDIIVNPDNKKRISTSEMEVLRQVRQEIKGGGGNTNNVLEKVSKMAELLKNSEKIMESGRKLGDITNEIYEKIMKYVSAHDIEAISNLGSA